MAPATSISLSRKLSVAFATVYSNLWFPARFASRSSHTYISSILTSLFAVVEKQTFFCRELVCFSSLFCFSFSPIFCPGATYRLISTRAFWSFCPLVPPDWCWPIHIRRGGGVFSKKELAFSSPSFFSLFFACLSCGVLFGDGGFRTTGKLGYTLSHTVASRFFKKSRRSRPQQFQKSLQYPGWTVKCNYPLLFLQKKLFKNVTFSSGKFSRFHSFLTLYRLINVLINSENNR